jgi:hypothetical protein
MEGYTTEEVLKCCVDYVKDVKQIVKDRRGDQRGVNGSQSKFS